MRCQDSLSRTADSDLALSLGTSCIQWLVLETLPQFYTTLQKHSIPTALSKMPETALPCLVFSLPRSQSLFLTQTQQTFLMYILSSLSWQMLFKGFACEQFMQDDPRKQILKFRPISSTSWWTINIWVSRVGWLLEYCDNNNGSTLLHNKLLQSLRAKNNCCVPWWVSVGHFSKCQWTLLQLESLGSLIGLIRVDRCWG